MAAEQTIKEYQEKIKHLEGQVRRFERTVQDRYDEKDKYGNGATFVACSYDNCSWWTTARMGCGVKFALYRSCWGGCEKDSCKECAKDHNWLRETIIRNDGPYKIYYCEDCRTERETAKAEQQSNK